MRSEVCWKLRKGIEIILYRFLTTFHFSLAYKETSMLAMLLRFLVLNPALLAIMFPRWFPGMCVLWCNIPTTCVSYFACDTVVGYSKTYSKTKFHEKESYSSSISHQKILKKRLVWVINNTNISFFLSCIITCNLCHWSSPSNHLFVLP